MIHDPIEKIKFLTIFLFRQFSSLPHAAQLLPQREKRNTPGEIRGMLSITNNFEVLRQRYLDTIKERNRLRARRQDLNQDQIQENQNFLDSVG